MSVDPQFEKKGDASRAHMRDMEGTARKLHPGTVDFAAYVQAHDRRYLGFQGELYLGRPTGNDSSNLCSLTNPPQYWKRYYYKGEALKEVFDEADHVAEKRYGRKPPPVDISGVFKLGEQLRDDVLVAEKPKEVTGRPITFHSVLSHKYTDSLGKAVEADAKPYQYCKQAHMSKKSELHFIASQLYRKDRDLILDRPSVFKRTSSLQTHFPDQLKEVSGAASSVEAP
ncbi:unnamed protein product [Amoebophrya sp. A25]|nr:unnamed protein product [Amoebophrya sp. A25]|eukprot:GSA25T00020433001.1